MTSLATHALSVTTPTAPLVLTHAAWVVVGILASLSLIGFSIICAEDGGDD